jgi:triacylglycerol lipase
MTAIHRRYRAAAAAAVTLMLVAGFLTASATATAAPVTTSDGDCTAEGNPQLEKAAALTAKPDRDLGGKPIVVDPAGNDVAVIFVHGWVSQSAHKNARTGAFSGLIGVGPTKEEVEEYEQVSSLIGRVQDIDRASVYTFDYHRDASKWVTSPKIGAALGAAIDCLYYASGRQVIVVGHSMGGLATRQALQLDDDRAAKIARVVTFGTPNTGSDMAAIASMAYDTSDALNDPVGLGVRTILSACGSAASNDMADVSPWCGPTFISSMRSEAGLALRTGSRDMATLEPWPAGLDVVALAGDNLARAKLGHFGFRHVVSEFSAGDPVVSLNSAVASATSTVVTTCHWDINTDIVPILIKFTWVAWPNKLDACFHDSLMKSITLTNRAVDAIAETIDQLPANPNVDLRGVVMTPTTIGGLAMAGSTKDDIVAMISEASGDQSFESFLTCEGYTKWGCAVLPAANGGAASSITFDVAPAGSRPSGADDVRQYRVDFAQDTPFRHRLPTTAKGLGYGDTMEEFKAEFGSDPAYDMLTSENPELTSFPSTSSDGRTSSSWVSISPNEWCSLFSVTFHFDEAGVLVAAEQYTMWDDCGGETDPDAEVIE